MNGFRRALFATIIVIALPAAQASASTFDGAWNVRISSSSETCGNGSTVAIGINNGQIASSSAMVTASGRVADAGSINVTNGGTSRAPCRSRARTRAASRSKSVQSHACLLK